MALALASRALRAHGRDTTGVCDALRHLLPITASLGNHAAAAAALYALRHADTPATF